MLALLTDHGPREVLVKYVALPRHRLSPGSINLGTLIDGEDEKEVYFDLVHREVFERGKPHAEASLQVPPQFSMEMHRIARDRLTGRSRARLCGQVIPIDAEEQRLWTE